MARQLLLLAGSLAAFAEGKDALVAETSLANCRSALVAVGTRNPIEVAALCRSALPSEMCRDALAHLGPQPWNSEKVRTACEKFVPMLAPIKESKGRFLDDLGAKLALENKCSTVDPTTGIKLLKENPWKPKLKGFNPFVTPTYILSKAAKTPTPASMPMPPPPKAAAPPQAAPPAAAPAATPGAASPWKKSPGTWKKTPGAAKAALPPTTAAPAATHGAASPKKWTPGTATAPVVQPPVVEPPVAQAPAERNVVKGTLQASMAHGTSYLVVSGSKKALQSAIGAASGITENVITIDHIASDSESGGRVNVSFTVQCQHHTAMVTTKQNLADTPKYTWHTLLKSKVNNDMNFVHIFIKDEEPHHHHKPADWSTSQAEIHRAHQVHRTHVRMPPLPKKVPKTAVLGTVDMMSKDIATMNSDPAFQKAIVLEIAAVGEVDVSKTTVTSVQIYPDELDNGAASIGGLVSVYFSINTTSARAANNAVELLKGCNLEDFGYRMWQTMLEIGSNQHFIMVQGVDAELASDVDAHPSASLEAALNPLSVAPVEEAQAARGVEKAAPEEKKGFAASVAKGFKGLLGKKMPPMEKRTLEDKEKMMVVDGLSDVKQDVLSRVEVHEGRSLAKDSALAATWAAGMMAGAALCAMGAVALAKVWKRRPNLDYSPREVPIVGDDHWGCMSRAEAPAAGLCEEIE